MEDCTGQSCNSYWLVLRPKILYILLCILYMLALSCDLLTLSNDDVTGAVFIVCLVITGRWGLAYFSRWFNHFHLLPYDSCLLSDESHDSWFDPSISTFMQFMEFGNHFVGVDNDCCWSYGIYLRQLALDFFNCGLKCVLCSSFCILFHIFIGAWYLEFQITMLICLLTILCFVGYDGHSEYPIECHLSCQPRYVSGHCCWVFRAFDSFFHC